MSQLEYFEHNLQGMIACVFFWSLNCSAVSEVTLGRPLMNLFIAKSNLGVVS